MRVALLKPDHGGVGGFERLLEQTAARLRAGGLDVQFVGFDAKTRADRVFGVPIDRGIRDWHDDTFLYFTAFERLTHVDLDDFDVVVATQPPSYLAAHDRLVALTYHQARVFHDLADLYVESGFAAASVHDAACAEVRALDATRVGNVHRWVTPSDEVATRLEQSWGITETVAFRAVADMAPGGRESVERYDPMGPALCVSRHEWPKRTELAVAAAHLLGPETPPVELIGGGSRHGWIEHLDRALAANDGGRETSGRALWACRGIIGTDDAEFDVPGRTGTSPVRETCGTIIHGEVSDAVKHAAYDRSGVVLAPAHREDYGLTVLEAFCHGRPVIVCDDGGGLVELVADTGAGLIVPPTPSAIADAVRTLRADPDRATAMAAAAMDAAVARSGVDDLRPLLDAITTAGTVRS